MQTFRHPYVVHLLQNQIDLKTVQKLLGYKLHRFYFAQKEISNKLLSPLDIA